MKRYQLTCTHVDGDGTCSVMTIVVVVASEQELKERIKFYETCLDLAMVNALLL